MSAMQRVSEDGLRSQSAAAWKPIVMLVPSAANRARSLDRAPTMIVERPR
jgi:hypothetical protein